MEEPGSWFLADDAGSGVRGELQSGLAEGKVKTRTLPNQGCGSQCLFAEWVCATLRVSHRLCLEHVDYWECIASHGGRPSHPIWCSRKPTLLVL